MTSRGFCKNCGGPKEAHFVPDKDWPDGVCVCTMPDSPCGCSGFVPKEKTPPVEPFNEVDRW